MTILRRPVVQVAWSTPPRDERWVLAGGCDSRFLRFFCGDADQLATAVPEILLGKAVKVPCLVGDPKAVSAETAALREIDADTKAMDFSNMADSIVEPWSTGNARLRG